MSITRTAPYGTLTDDTGGGTDGTVFNNAWLQGMLNLIDARWSRTSTTLTGTQAVVDPSEADVLLCNNASTLTIRSITAPSSPAKPGKKLVVVAIGAGNVFLNHQDTSGTTAANRMMNRLTSGTTPLAPGGVAMYVYDDSVSRWRMLFHDQSFPIGVTLSDGSGAGLTLTQVARYYVRGLQVFVEFDIAYPSTADGSNAAVAGLPYTSLGTLNGTVVVSYSTFGAGIYMVTQGSSASMTFWDLSGTRRTNAHLSLKNFQGRAIYFTS